MTVVAFRSGGKIVRFNVKKRSPAKTRKELEKRLKKLKSPKMRQMAREKWLSAH